MSKWSSVQEGDELAPEKNGRHEVCWFDFVEGI